MHTWKVRLLFLACVALIVWLVMDDAQTHTPQPEPPSVQKEAHQPKHLPEQVQKKDPWKNYLFQIGGPCLPLIINKDGQKCLSIVKFGVKDPKHEHDLALIICPEPSAGALQCIYVSNSCINLHGSAGHQTYQHTTRCWGKTLTSASGAAPTRAH